MSHFINFVLCSRAQKGGKFLLLLLFFLFFFNFDAQFLLLSRKQNENTHAHTHTYTSACQPACLPYLAFALSRLLAHSLFHSLVLATPGALSLSPRQDDVSFWNANCTYDTHTYNCLELFCIWFVCVCVLVHNWFCYVSVANLLISGPLKIEISTALKCNNILLQNLHKLMQRIYTLEYLCQNVNKLIQRVYINRKIGI